MLPLAITGLGVVSPLGIGREAFFAALRDARQAREQRAFAGRATCSTDARFARARVAEVRDFDAAQYLGDKGLRNFDRLTRMLIVAAKHALEDAGLKRDGAFAALRARARRHLRGHRLRLARQHHRDQPRRGARAPALPQPVALPQHGDQLGGWLRQHLGGARGAQRHRRRRQLRLGRRRADGRDAPRQRPRRCTAGGRRRGAERAALSRVREARRGQRGRATARSRATSTSRGTHLGEGAALLVLEARGGARAARGARCSASWSATARPSSRRPPRRSWCTASERDGGARGARGAARRRARARRHRPGVLRRERRQPHGPGRGGGPRRACSAPTCATRRHQGALGRDLWRGRCTEPGGGCLGWLAETPPRPLLARRARHDRCAPCW